MCTVGAHEMRIKLAGAVPVGGVFAMAGNKATVFDPVDMRVLRRVCFHV